MLVSAAAMAENPQQVPQGFWNLTGVTTPLSLKSNFSGNVSVDSATGSCSMISPCAFLRRKPAVCLALPSLNAGSTLLFFSSSSCESVSGTSPFTTISDGSMPSILARSSAEGSS